MKFISLILSFLLAFSSVGCSTADNKIGMTRKPETTEYTTQITPAEMYKEHQALLALEGINDVVITINGQSITKLEIEMSKIQYNYANYPDKVIIDDVVRKRVVNIKADKLGIKADDAQCDALMEQTRTTLEEMRPGAEYIYEYMEVADMTVDEYIEYTKRTLYPMYQRDALIEHLGIEGEEAYEEYIDELVQKADIEILDDDIRKLYE